MKKYQTLMEESAVKMNTIMLAMVELDESDESEEIIFNLVKETFSYDELVFSVCMEAGSLLEKTIKKYPELGIILLRSKEINKNKG